MTFCGLDSSAQDRKKWWALLNAIRNLWVQNKIGFLAWLKKYMLLQNDSAP
jgi:hypothetical protein